MAQKIEPAPNHVMFQAPAVTYTPYSPGGTIQGTIADGWEPVRAAFAQNFAEGYEKGAQLVIRVNGHNVVDLHGFSDSCTTTKGPYDGDTIQNIFSSGKQIETMVVAMLVERGLVDYDSPVATYWPEFAQGDKGAITIADVLRHEGKCPWFLDPAKCQPGEAGSQPDHFLPLSLEDHLSTSVIDKRIETNPRVEFGANTDGSPSPRAYHAVTRGFLVDGVLRRVDSKGRGIAEFVDEEICAPLGVTEYKVAIPEDEQNKFNIAHITPALSTYAINMEFGPTLMGIHPRAYDLGNVLHFMNPTRPISMSKTGSCALTNDATGRIDASRAGTAPLIAMPVSSAFTNSSARAQALIYATYAEGGSSVLSAEGVSKAFEKESQQLDTVLNKNTIFTQGGISKMDALLNDTPEHTEAKAGFKDLYGWEGIGGSKCLVDREKKATVIYTMSGMTTPMVNCPRMNRLMTAYQACR